MEGNTSDLVWISEGRAPSLEKVPSDGRRRTHTKSRKGCEQCKRSKIKCDESRPACAQCQHRKRQCSYAMSPERSDTDLQPEAELRLTTMSRILSRAQIHDTLQEAGPLFMSLPIDHLECLDHFSQYKPPWMGASAIQEGLQTFGLEIAIQVPSLLHTILAFSASHMAFLTGGQTSYDLASVAHFQQALHLFVKELGDCVSLSLIQKDALFGNSLLISMLGFSQVRQANEDADTDDEEHVDFSWIPTMAGVSFLVTHEVLREHLTTSRWFPIWASTGYQITPEVVLDTSERAETVVAIFLRLCGLDGESQTLEDNPFEGPVRLLVPLMTTTGDAALAFIVKFICELSRPFLQLLNDNEPRAMLIMAHWCAAASSIDQWWIQERARDLCWQICWRFRDVEDLDMTVLMEDAATACGYALPLRQDRAHVVEEESYDAMQA